MVRNTVFKKDLRHPRFSLKRAFSLFKLDRSKKFPSPLHFRDEKTKVQRGEVTCLKLHIKSLAKTKLKFRSADSQCNVNFPHQSTFFYTIIFTN